MFYLQLSCEYPEAVSFCLWEMKEPKGPGESICMQVCVYVCVSYAVKEPQFYCTRGAPGQISGFPSTTELSAASPNQAFDH